MQSFSISPWDLKLSNLQQLPLHDFQLYSVFVHMRGNTQSELGPEWTSVSHRAGAQAAFGYQKASGNSKRGLTYAISPGLTPAEHVAAAIELPTPFCAPTARY